MSRIVEYTGWTRDEILDHTQSFIEMIADGSHKNRLYDVYGKQSAVFGGSPAMEQAGVKFGGWGDDPARVRRKARAPDR